MIVGLSENRFEPDIFDYQRANGPVALVLYLTDQAWILAWMTKSNRQHPPAGNWRIHTAGDVGNFQKSFENYQNSEIKKMYGLVISSKIVQPFCERWGFRGRRAHLWQHGATSQHVELQGLKVTLRTLRTLRGRWAMRYVDMRCSGRWHISTYKLVTYDVKSYHINISWFHICKMCGIWWILKS